MSFDQSHQAPDDGSPQLVIEYRLKHGLCYVCGTQVCRVEKSDDPFDRFIPLSIPGVSHYGRCLYCHPFPKNQEDLMYSGDLCIKTEEEEDERLPRVRKRDDDTATIMDVDGLLFVGTVLEGNKTRGRGKFTHVFDEDSDKAGKAIVYVGEFQNGKLHGKGVSQDYGAGCVYDGTFVDGAAHGYGTCKWDQGWEYVGEWARDKRNGFGTCRQLEDGGEVYEGEWRHDRWEGKGVLRFAGGGRYDGEFKSNKLHGWGKYHFADGSIYDGFFRNDLREGHGSMVYVDGVRYVGEWRNNWRNGKGTLFLSDGSVFKGRFRADERDGNGLLHMPDGIVRKERYVNGVLQT